MYERFQVVRHSVPPYKIVDTWYGDVFGLTMPTLRAAEEYAELWNGMSRWAYGSGWTTVSV